MAGPIMLDSVQLLCGSDVYNHGIFLNGRVYVCHTTVTELDSVYEVNYAGNTPQAVMSVDTLCLRWKNGDWQGLGFDSPFDYNGADNLILEFRWQGDNDSSVYNLGWYTSGYRAVGAKSSTADRGVPRNYMPRLRIFYSPTGIAEESPTHPMDGLTVSATPNPFRTGVSLRLDGERRLLRSAAVFGSDGQLVRRLEPAGTAGELYWDGCDVAGRRVGPGTYFCRVLVGSRTGILHLVHQN